MKHGLSRRRAVLAGLLVATLRPALGRDQPRPAYLARSEVQQLIDELVWKHGFERPHVERWIAAARHSPASERLMLPQPPFGQRSWPEYRARVLTEERIRAGVSFLQKHAQSCEQARERFGVPPEIIAAIIGIETHFGRQTGSFRTIDVMATLAFDYPRRAEYYRREFVEFLLMAREQGLEPLAVRGSFAGAIGLPQFMPGSIRRFAVDFDGDGRIDLTTSPADAIGSVASFLVAHGWQRDVPILFEAEATEEIVDALGRGIEARVSWHEAGEAGVVADLPLLPDAQVIVIDLPSPTPAGVERQFRVGTTNFSAILHYNRSYFYATAVVEFAQAIADASASKREGPATPASSPS